MTSRLTDRWWLAPLCILSAIGLAYSGTLNAPWVLDDLPGILNNVSIRDIWNWNVLMPPKETVVMMGRPLVNLTLALNFAFGKLNVQGYHLVNIFFHVLTAWALFGVVRRTLLLPQWNHQLTPNRWAFAVALLWGVHPLCTAAVTYLVQRAEILASLFYLLTLYGLIRSHESGKKWQIFSVGMCAFGMTAKEIVATAPLVALLYDRAFLSASFRECLTKRWKYYVALAATWGILIVLMTAQPWRGGAVGFSEQASWWDYLRTQTWAVTQYLWLSLIPYPLVFDYGKELMTDWGIVIPRGIFLIALLTGSMVAFRKKTWLGFLGLSFFMILAPTSSFIPLIYQTIAEHRVYLASSIIVIFIVAAGHHYLPKKIHFGAFAVTALIFVTTTFWRNADYRSPLRLWDDTVRKRPNNERALNNRGNLLAETKDPNRMIADFNRAIALNPKFEGPFNNRANVWAQLGHFQDALEDYTRAIELKPDYVEAWHNRANVYTELGRWKEACADYSKAIELKPDLTLAYFSRGKALLMLHRPLEAMADFHRVIQIDSNHTGALNNLAWFLATQTDPKIKNPKAAIALAERAVALTQAQDPIPLGTLAVAYSENGDFDRAVVAAQRAMERGRKNGNVKLVEETEKNLKLYQSKKPYHQGALNQ